MWFDLEHIPILTEPYFGVLMFLGYTRMSRKYVKVFKVVMIPCLIFFYVTFFTNKFHHIYISKFEFVSNGHFNVLVEEIYYKLFSILEGLGRVSEIVRKIKWVKNKLLTEYDINLSDRLKEVYSKYITLNIEDN